jgi:hypothetical protein
MAVHFRTLAAQRNATRITWPNGEGSQFGIHSWGPVPALCEARRGTREPVI